MNIGQAAKRSGISAKMIRYYEDIGLLPNPKRSDSGYRVYSDDDMKTLSFIQHAREWVFFRADERIARPVAERCQTQP